MRTIIISESQKNILDKILNDPLLDDVGQNFSFQILKTSDWKNGKEIDAYCQTCGLQEIGHGISRKVYAIDDRLVLKIDYSSTYSQNDSELSAYRNMSEDLREFVPMILDFDRDHIKPLWLVSERVIPASYVDFKKILGFDFGSYTSAQDIKDTETDLKNYSDYPSAKDKKFNLMDFLESFGEKDLSLYKQEIQNNKWLNNLYRLLVNGFVSYYELEMIDNWGLVQRNGKPQLIILDVGI